MVNKDIEYPFVSIIIPAYNESRFIEQCLNSVLLQNWPHDRMEIIVVDNGSTDDTYRIASTILSRSFRGVTLKKNGGSIASVRNFGWHHSKGELLAFLDADSLVENCWLQKGYDLLRKFENSSAVGFSVSSPTPSDSWVERTWYPISSSGKQHGTKVVGWLSTFNIIIKRECFEKIDGFDESLETCEDVDLGNRLSEFSHLVFSDSCRVQHLGNVKKIIEFFNKERWRGRNSFQQFTNSSHNVKAIISLMVPLFYLVLLIIFLIMTLFFRLNFIFIYSCIVFLIIFIPVALSLRAGIRTFKKLFSTSYLYFVYLLARGVALVPRLR